jgi:RHH-type proline utilization regulon transcriptional repressor/proline dehydrogenase/delta 1-pyrroline-5-carboxylate dehydrogenase
VPDEAVVSTAVALPAAVNRALQDAGVETVVEDANEWAARVARLAAKMGADSGSRIRLIGGSAATTADAAGGKPDVAIYASDVVAAGRVELLTFLREQAVSITAHRFGTPNQLSEAAI